MKNNKIFLTTLGLLIGALGYTHAYAADYSKSTRPIVKTKAESMATGKLESVTPADVKNGVLAKLSILDKDGKKSNYNVASTAGIIGQNKAKLSLTDLKKGDAVKVHFIYKTGGGKEATGIDVLKS